MLSGFEIFKFFVSDDLKGHTHNIFSLRTGRDKTGKPTLTNPQNQYHCRHRNYVHFIYFFCVRILDRSFFVFDHSAVEALASILHIVKISLCTLIVRQPILLHRTPLSIIKYFVNYKLMNKGYLTKLRLQCRLINKLIQKKFGSIQGNNFVSNLAENSTFTFYCQNQILWLRFYNFSNSKLE